MSISEIRKNVMTNAGEKKELMDMEREIRLGRIGAELEHREEVRQLRKTVSREAQAVKAMV